MPNGKPAGMPCIQMNTANQCMIFGKPERPAFCASLQPSNEMCGDSRAQAIRWLSDLEQLTKPN
jgi:hypothetical protein